MADIASQIQDRVTRENNQALQLADHNSQWASFFTSTPPADVLRQQRNVADMVTAAVDRKQQLMAQTDLKSQQLQESTERFKQFQQDAPLRSELLRRQVESQGAHERFLQQKDAQTMADSASFYDYLSRAPAPQDPNYKGYIASGIQKFPRVIGTAAGKEVLDNLMKEHQDIDSTLAGMTPSTAIIKTDNGTLTYKSPDQVKKDTGETAQADKDRKYAADNLAKARDNRISAQRQYDSQKKSLGPKGQPDKSLLDAADKDVIRFQTQLDAAEARISGGATPPVNPQDPRIEIARRALNSPDATPEHKAAARRILGL